MKSITILAGALIGGLAWLISQEKPKAVLAPPPTEPIPPAEKPVSRAELKRVMSHLGKLSGEVRGGK